jgi:recombination protein RecT
MNELTTIQTQLITELPDLKTILPKHISGDEFVRCAAVAMVNNDLLMNCDRKSLLMSLSACAQDGLIPDGKEAALIPFNCNTAKKGEPPAWVNKAQYMPMIDGVLKRARMSGEIKTIASKAVYENDAFDYWLDEEGEHINYRPVHSEKGNFKLAFAFAKMNNGELLVEVMNKDEIDKVRSASKTGSFGPWKDWYDRMACKSVTHRMARRLPNSSEIIRMMETALDVEFNNEIRKSEPVDVIPVSGFYSDDDFSVNFPKWKAAIEAGKSSPAHVVKMVSAKAELSTDQLEKINALKTVIEGGK